MTTIDKKKNVSIELLRVVACMLVVAAHYFMPHRMSADGMSYNVATIFMESFVHCSPPVFFMVAGFFMFDRDKKVWPMIRYVITKILLPAWIIIFLSNIFDGFLHSEAGFIDCLTGGHIDVENLLYSILMWHDGAINAYHIWYMFALAYVYILYPVMKLLCKKDPQVDKIRRYVLVISIGYFIMKGTFDVIVGRQVFFFPAVFAYWPMTYVLLGYEWKRFYEKYIKEATTTVVYQLAGIGMFLLGGVLTFLLSYYVDIGGNGTYGEAFLDFTMLGLFINSVGLFLWGISVRVKSYRAQKIIVSMGKNTFVAYLVHLMILIKLRSMGMEEAISGIIGTNPFINAVVCVLIYFTAAMGVAYLYNGIKERIIFRRYRK